jgi:hypothetical protein
MMKYPENEEHHIQKAHETNPPQSEEQNQEVGSIEDAVRKTDPEPQPSQSEQIEEATAETQDPNDPDEDEVLENDQKVIDQMNNRNPAEGETVFGQTGLVTPSGPVPASPYSMMQRAQERLGDQYPESEEPPQSKSEMMPMDRIIKEEQEAGVEVDYSDLLSDTNQMETQMTIQEIPPASTTSSPPVNIGSTPESPAKPSGTDRTTKLRSALLEFLKSETFSPDWVRQQLNVMETGSALLPPSTSWLVPSSVNLSAVIYEIVLNHGYVDAKWPALELIMGNSLDNTTWTAAVLCFFAFGDAAVVLGKTRAMLSNMGGA